MIEGVERGTVKPERWLRCLACGTRFSCPSDAPAPRLCPACASSSKPVDTVMRWIWQDLDEAGAT